MVKPAKRGAANEQIAEKLPSAPQQITDAVKALKSFKGPKFDQTIEVCVHLGIDPRQAEQQLRGSISMPKGVGRTARVICFCNEDLAKVAREAGAVEAGGAELIEKIQGCRRAHLPGFSEPGDKPVGRDPVRDRAASQFRQRRDSRRFAA